MSARVRSRLLVAVLGGALALLAGAPAAQAATTAAPETTLSVGKLVLTPVAGGYEGSLPVTVSHRGTEPESFDVHITEPVPGSLVSVDTEAPCLWMSTTADDRRISECGAPGRLLPGESRTFHATFRVRTAPRPYAMSALGGSVTLTQAGGVTVSGAKSFSTAFRSTTGSLKHPRPYHQDTLTNASISAGVTDAVLSRQADGRYAGWVPITVRYDGDRANDRIEIGATLPAGVMLWDMQPSTVCLDTCRVPGGQFGQGEQRTVSVLLVAPADATPGVFGAGSLSLHTWYTDHEIADQTPADNTTTFQVSLAS